MIGGAVGATQISEQTALQVAAVYGCCSLIADSIASLPVDLLSTPRRRTGTTLPPSPLLTQPYAEISAMDWWVQFTLSLALRGNFFGQIIQRDSQLYPTQIKPLHPDNVRVRRIPNTGAIEYRYLSQVIPLRDIFHVKLLSVPEALVGLNPIDYLRNILGLARAGDLYAASFYQNSAMPSGVIQVPSDTDLDQDETEALKRQWQQLHQGIGNAQLPAVLTGGSEFKPITITPEQAQFLQSRQYSAAVICGQIFRVPPHMIGIVDRTTSWGCLPGESLVFTTSGPKPIEDVKVGDEVWSVGAERMEPAKVTGWQMTGYKPLLAIQTTGRTVRATSAHHIPVRRYFGRSDGRKMGECGWETVLLDAKDVRVGDYLLVPHGLDAGDGEREAPNGRPLTVAAMEFCGMYLGDGSMDKNRIEIAHETEPDHMEHYVGCAVDEFGAAPYVDKRRTRTRFSSLEARELLECGFTGTALTKRIPGWVFKLAPDLQLALLRGYLDADGSVQHGRIVYASANPALLEDVRHLCIQLGIPTGRVCLGELLNKTLSAPLRPLGVCGVYSAVARGRLGGRGVIHGREHVSHPKYQLSLSSLPFNIRIGSNSPRKAARFVDTPHQRVGRYDRAWTGTANNAQGAGVHWQYDDIVLQRVIRITEAKLAVPVYDIEVNGPATFVADGVIVGNTGIEQQELGYVRNTLVGYISRAEKALTALHPPGQYVKFDLSDRLRGDRLQRTQASAMGIAGGFLLPDEARAIEDLPPLPGGIGQTAIAPINAQTLMQMATASVQKSAQQANVAAGQSGDQPQQP